MWCRQWKKALSLSTCGEIGRQFRKAYCAPAHDGILASGKMLSEWRVRIPVIKALAPVTRKGKSATAGGGTVWRRDDGETRSFEVIEKLYTLSVHLRRCFRSVRDAIAWPGQIHPRS